MTHVSGKVFDLNKTALKQHHPDLLVWADNAEVSSDYQIIETESGNPNLRVKPDTGAVLLHLSPDPSKEVEQYLKLVPEKANGVVVLMGMGLGYAAEAILQERTNLQGLVIFELDPVVFRCALETRDLRPLLSDSRVSLGIGENCDVEGILQRNFLALHLETVHTVRHLPSFSYQKEQYTAFDKRVYEILNYMNVAGATVMHFGKQFVENRFENLRTLRHDCVVDNLLNVAENVPAILVSAGPSLNKNIDLLHRAKGKAVILAVDSAVPALAANGISPDFVTTIDPQPIVFEKIAGVKFEEAPSLICLPVSNPKVPKIFASRKVYWGFSYGKMEMWLNTALGGAATIGQSQTVAHLNLNIASLMGCSPVVFIGQDLAFSGNEDHAANTVLTSNHLVEKKEKANELIWLDGINGGKVRSSRAFVSMKTVFEEFIAGHNNTYINATEGGAKIEGTESMTLADVLDRFCRQDIGLEKAILAKREASAPKIENLLTEFRKTIDEIKHIEVTIAEALKLGKRIHSYLAGGGKKRKTGIRPQTTRLANIDKNINKLDKLNKELDAKYSIWELLDELTLEGLKESERLLVAIRKIDQRKNYNTWLRKNIIRLEHVNGVRQKCLAILKRHLLNLLSFWQEEKYCEDSISAETGSSSYLKLLELYQAHDEFVLAENLIEKMKEKGSSEPLMAYSEGVLAACRMDYDQAEESWQKAVSGNNSLTGRINAVRQARAQEYFLYSERTDDFDDNTCTQMVLKGLRLFSDSPLLREKLVKYINADIAAMESAVAAGGLEACAGRLSFWGRVLQQDWPLVADVVGNATTGRLWKYQANFLMLSRKYAEAIDCCSSILQITPEDPELYLLAADICFATDEFAQGIQFLEKAVSLNPTLATYWENIGDVLSGNGQFEDAISAYEKCFVALPDYYPILKKIGDCHMKLDNLPAAREAYRQVTSLNQNQ